jgi:carnosine N-methyltransferase
MRRYVLKNLVRDWGEEGAAERAQSYGRILSELRDRFGVCAG